MKILITGANGQLGRDLLHILSTKNVDVYGYRREELDVTRIDVVREILFQVRPQVIVHTAAYTHVDQAEQESEQAYAVNVKGSRHIAAVAEEIGAKLCYVSTDFVFDGQQRIPYLESDQTNPLSVYGKSKYEGEECTKLLCAKHFIVRTAWIYGSHGQNFVKTMLNLAQDREEISVVSDQMGSPTYTLDLAECIYELILTEHYGTYHVSNSGQCTWYDFAQAIFEESGINLNVKPITTHAFGSKAPRPSYSVLDHQHLRQIGIKELRHWREALQDFLQKRKNTKELYEQ